jgi:hypothetical protein
MMDGKVCEHFPVNADLFLVESGDQTGIGYVVQARGSIDTRDPQCSEFAFLCPTMAVGVCAGLIDVMLRNSVNLAAGAPVSFGRSKKFFSSPMRGNLIL